MTEASVRPAHYSLSNISVPYTDNHPCCWQSRRKSDRCEPCCWGCMAENAPHSAHNLSGDTYSISLK